MKELALMFLTVYAVERSAETFWKRDKIRGKISATFTLPLLVGTYVLMYLACLWELTGWNAGPFSAWVSVGGAVIVLVSTVGRNWDILALGPYHSIHIEIRADHELIQSGPYRWIRNPYYLSNIIEAIGLPLLANAHYAALISVFVYIPMLVLRIILEERALGKKFHREFASYKLQAPRIIPSLGGRRRRFAEPSMIAKTGNDRSSLVETKS